MKYVLRITRYAHRRLADLLREALPAESVAFLLCRREPGSSAVVYLVDDVVAISPAEYMRQDVDIANVSPAAMARVSKLARAGGSVIVMAHLHPGCLRNVEFSPADHRGNARSFRFFHQRVIVDEHIALVFNETIDRCRGLVYRSGGDAVALDSYAVVDDDLWRDLTEPSRAGSVEVFSRQALMLGQAGQQRLSQVRLAVVGLGGLGSVFSMLAVHHGFGGQLLVDDDVVELSNLPRIVGSTHQDVDAQLPKVQIAARYAQGHAPSAEVQGFQTSVEDSSIRPTLITADAIVICTDNTTSRAFLNQLAQQYLIPVLDMGVEFVVNSEGAVVNEVGRINLMRPSTACLICSGQVDPRRLSAESIPREDRQKDGSYLRGMDDPQPSMMAFNMEVAARGMQVLVGFITGLMVTAADVYESRSFLRRKGGSLSRQVAKRRRDDCIVCGTQGVVGRGSVLPMAVSRRAA